MKDQIKAHFSGNFDYFYSKYLPDRKKIGGGDEFAACCPFHQDSSPSLNYNNQTGQFFCHGCGEKGDYLTFYGKQHNLDTKTQFKEIIKRISADFGIQVQPPKIVKTYDYHNAEGKLIFQVCRYEPKTFKQRRPNGLGDWTWDMKGVDICLYNLPEILKAEEVLVVEGEKDVDRLKELGFSATTNPMGAGKWRDEYAHSLQGRHVVLLPDNDPVGLAHMENVDDSLTGLAASVKTIILPDLPEKGDVSDWIKQKGESAASELRALINSIPTPDTPPPLKPKAKPPSKKKLKLADIENGTEGETRAEACGLKAEDLLSKLGDKKDEITVLLNSWDEKNKPPLGEDEIKKILESVITSRNQKKITNENSSSLFSRIEKLIYPDGIVKYQVYVSGHHGYVTMEPADFISKTRFKTKFLALTDISPNLPKNWDDWVTETMKMAVHVFMEEEETPMGAISSILKDARKENKFITDMNTVGNNIVSSNGSVFLTMNHLEGLLSRNNYRLDSRQIGDLLRKMNGIKTIKWVNGRQKKVWEFKVDE